MILRCQGPHPRIEGATCYGIVGWAPEGSYLARPLARYDEAAEDCHAGHCRRCETIYEIRRVRLTEAA